MENTQRLSEEFKGYKNIFHKCGIDLYDLDHMDQYYQITMTTEMYEKKAGNKTISKKPTETKTEIIDARQFACYLSGICFFGDRIEKGYTYIGYVVKKMSCYNPDKTKRRVTYFKYEKK